MRCGKVVRCSLGQPRTNVGPAPLRRLAQIKSLRKPEQPSATLRFDAEPHKQCLIGIAGGSGCTFCRAAAVAGASPARGPRGPHEGVEHAAALAIAKLSTPFPTELVQLCEVGGEARAVGDVLWLTDCATTSSMLNGGAGEADELSAFKELLGASRTASPDTVAAAVIDSSLPFSAILSALMAAWPEQRLRIPAKLREALVAKWVSHLDLGVLSVVDVAHSYATLCVSLGQHQLFAQLLGIYINRELAEAVAATREVRTLRLTVDFIAQLLEAWLQLHHGDVEMLRLFAKAVTMHCVLQERTSSARASAAANSVRSSPSLDVDEGSTFEMRYPSVAHEFVHELLLLSAEQSAGDPRAPPQVAAELLQPRVLAQLPSLALRFVDRSKHVARQLRHLFLFLAPRGREEVSVHEECSNGPSVHAAVELALRLALRHMGSEEQLGADSEIQELWADLLRCSVECGFWESSGVRGVLFADCAGEGSESVAGVFKHLGVARGLVDVALLHCCGGGAMEPWAREAAAAVLSALCRSHLDAALALLISLRKQDGRSSLPVADDSGEEEGGAAAVAARRFIERTLVSLVVRESEARPCFVQRLSASRLIYLSSLCVENGVASVSELLAEQPVQQLAAMAAQVAEHCDRSAGCLSSPVDLSQQRLLAVLLRCLLASCEAGAESGGGGDGDRPDDVDVGGNEDCLRDNALLLCTAGMRAGLDITPLLNALPSRDILTHLRDLARAKEKTVEGEQRRLPRGAAVAARLGVVDRERLQGVEVGVLMARFRALVADQSAGPTTRRLHDAGVGGPARLTVAEVAELGDLLFGQVNAPAAIPIRSSFSLLQAIEEHFWLLAGRRRDRHVVPTEEKATLNSDVPEHEGASSLAGRRIAPPALPSTVRELRGAEFRELLVILCRRRALPPVEADVLLNVVRAFPMPSPHQLYEDSLVLCVNIPRAGQGADEAPPDLGRLIDRIELLFPHGASGIFRSVAYRTRSRAAMRRLLDAMVRQYMLPAAPVAQRIRSVSRVRDLVAALAARGQLTPEEQQQVMRACWWECLASLLSWYNVVMTSLLGFLFATLWLKASPESTVVRWCTMSTLMPSSYALRFRIKCEGAAAGEPGGFELTAVVDGGQAPSVGEPSVDELVLGVEGATVLRSFVSGDFDSKTALFAQGSHDGDAEGRKEGGGEVGGDAARVMVITLNTKRSAIVLGCTEEIHEGCPDAGLLALIPSASRSAERCAVRLRLRTTSIQDLVHDAAWAFRLSTRSSSVTKPLHWYFSMVSLSSPLTRQMLIDSMQGVTYLLEVPRDVSVTPSFLRQLQRLMAGSNSRCVLLGSNSSLSPCGAALVNAAASRQAPTPPPAASAVTVGTRPHVQGGRMFPCLIGDVTPVVARVIPNEHRTAWTRHVARHATLGTSVASLTLHEQEQLLDAFLPLRLTVDCSGQPGPFEPYFLPPTRTSFISVMAALAREWLLLACRRTGETVSLLGTRLKDLNFGDSLQTQMPLATS